ncbi:DnaJ domain-containing protein [Candidatus Saccharibacteria bacterium]|nr:DnaJ domain-containing protein [Candidatus Saccharibacteria bacterium]
MNYREVLGVAHNASQEEIQAAFRKEALKHHPDVSASPEAAEAFMRIKEARDAMMKEAAGTHAETDADAIRRATDTAMKATAAATYATPSATTFVDDLYAGMTSEEIAYIQQLDQLARHAPKRSVFGRRVKESDEVRRHRKKLNTVDNRINGKY